MPTSDRSLAEWGAETWGAGVWGGWVNTGLPIVEIGFNADPLDPLATVVWTDVTDFFVEAATRRGRRHALGRFEAGTCQMLLRNEDRRFDPTNEASPYWPDVRPLRRLRIRSEPAGNSYTIFTGYIETWNQVYEGPYGAAVQVDASDALKILNLFAPESSPYAETVLGDTPYLYWRCGETHGNILADSSGNSRTGTVVAADLGAEGLLAGDPDRAVRVSKGHYASGGSAASFERTEAFSAEVWLNATSETNTFIFGRRADSGTLRGWWLSIDPEGRAWVIVGSDVGAGNNLDVRSETPINDGVTHHLVVTYDGSSTAAGITIYVDGLDRTGKVFADGLSATIVTGTELRLGPKLANWAGVVDEFAVYTSELSAAQVAAHYEAGIQPWFGQRTSERIEALHDLAGWPAGDRDIQRGDARLDAVSGLGGALEHAQAVADSELSGVYVRAQGQIRFDNRYVNIADSVSVLTFGEDIAAGEVPYQDVALAFDDEDLWTQVVASRSGGIPQMVSDATAVGSYGRRQLSVGGLWSDDNQAAGVAAQLLDRFVAPRARFEGLLLVPRSADMWDHMLGHDLHRERVTVKRRPPGGGDPVVQECWIEGVAHRIAPGLWQTVYTVVPADVAADYGRAG